MALIEREQGKSMSTSMIEYAGTRAENEICPAGKLIEFEGGATDAGE